jgi:hypothetical protein
VEVCLKPFVSALVIRQYALMFGLCGGFHATEVTCFTDVSTPKMFLDGEQARLSPNVFQCL